MIVLGKLIVTPLSSTSHSYGPPKQRLQPGSSENYFVSFDSFRSSEMYEYETMLIKSKFPT